MQAKRPTDAQALRQQAAGMNLTNAEIRALIAKRPQVYAPLSALLQEREQQAVAAYVAEGLGEV